MTESQPEEILGQAIASRVAVLRGQQKLSLDRLAERSGLSKGTVVAIENGRANPSIGILCRLAAALSVSVSDLLDGTAHDIPSSSIERTEPRRLWETENGSVAILHAALSGATMFELWSWVLEPGDRYETDAHGAGTPELVAVECGTLEIRIGSESRTLRTGEAARLRTDMPHSYRATGDAATRFSMAVLERSIPLDDQADPNSGRGMGARKSRPGKGNRRYLRNTDRDLS